jgi:hypothetical protein
MTGLDLYGGLIVTDFVIYYDLLQTRNLENQIDNDG